VRPTTLETRAGRTAAAFAALFFLATPFAGRAAAVGPGPLILLAEHSDGWDDWDDYNRTLLQMQRESISSQEEQSREAARAVRRTELEQSRAKAAAERETYFDAVIEASQASLRAPRGAYYRKPGFTSSEPPAAGSPVVEVGGIAYLYDRGIFWLQQGPDYLVVTTPVGAVVAELPRGAVRVSAAGGPVWYFFGAFFAESPGGYVVIRPTPGLTVFYLPDGYLRVKVGAADGFRFGETLYKPVFLQGILAYQVVEER
jgi:hypothetical protein